MIIRDIVSEDFTNYKKPSMFICMGTCDWKCCTEQNLDIGICQNSDLAQIPERDFDNELIIGMYTSNPITEAVVIGGLEPFTYTYGLYKFISDFRKICNDPIIIYTGYYPEELYQELNQFLEFENIIIKFGRFIPNHKPHLDKVLGVKLSSDNQYAVKLDSDFLNTITNTKDIIYDL